MTRSIIFPAYRARTVAEAILPHVSKDDVTPALTVAVIRGDRLVGTDRYSVGTILLQEPESASFHTMSDGQKVADSARRLVTLGGEIGEDDPTWEEDFYVPRAALQRMATLSNAQTMNGLYPEHRVFLREEFSEWVTAPSRVVGSIRTEERRYRDRFVTVAVADSTGSIEWYQRFSTPQFNNYPPVERLIEGWKPADGDGAVTFGLMGWNLDKVTKFAGKHQPIRATAGAPANGHKLAPLLLEVGSDFRALIQPTIIAQ